MAAAASVSPGEEEEAPQWKASTFAAIFPPMSPPYCMIPTHIPGSACPGWAIVLPLEQNHRAVLLGFRNT